MDLVKNRVAEELAEWKARESRFEKIFSPGILKDNAFMKEKLSFYDHLQAKYGRSGSDEEKLTLRVLARQRGELRKELYPNFLQRLFQKILEPVRERQTRQQVSQITDNNLKELKEVMKTFGFEGAADKLAAQLSQGDKTFTIPLSNFVDQQQKVSFDLSFSRQADGSYRFDDYRASLQKENKPQQTISQVFKADSTDAVSAQQAKNLLAGRAVMKDAYDLDGSPRSKWIQLDFNDKDAAGNYKMKEFLHSYGFDLQKAAERLIQKENLSAKNQLAILDGMRSGERQAVTIMRDNVSVNFYIEANPQFKTVNVYDESARKISISEALGEKPVTQRLQPKVELKASQSKKNGIGIW